MFWELRVSKVHMSGEKTHEENASQKKDCTTDNARVKGETACLRDTFDIQNALQAA